MIPSRLAKALGDRNWTQKDLAQATGITEAAVSRCARGQTAAREDTLVKICRALNVSADWLIGLEDE